MIRAAQGVFDSYDGWAGKRTLIVCGSGNNGGDGYALASIMANEKLDVCLLRVSDRFSDDGLYYFEKCAEKGVPVLVWGRDVVDFGSYDVIVDCMLGTGFDGVPREPIASVIRGINSAREA